MKTEMTEVERARLRDLIEYGNATGLAELQALAHKLLLVESEKSLRLAKLATAEDMTFVALKKQLEKVEGDLGSIPKYFRCSQCGQVPSLDGSWRYLGPVPYEHKCPALDPQCGYSPVRLIQPGEDGAAQPKEKGIVSPTLRAILTGLAAGFGVAAAQEFAKIESKVEERWIVKAPEGTALFPRCKCNCGKVWLPRDAVSVCSISMGTHVRDGACDPERGPAVGTV